MNKNINKKPLARPALRGVPGLAGGNWGGGSLEPHTGEAWAIPSTNRENCSTNRAKSKNKETQNTSRALPEYLVSNGYQNKKDHTPESCDKGRWEGKVRPIPKPNRAPLTHTKLQLQTYTWAVRYTGPPGL